MKKCLSYTQIDKNIIAKCFSPTRDYTLEEIRNKLKVSKKLSDKVLIDTLNKYCEVNKTDRNYNLVIKPDNTFIDCVRYKITQSDSHKQRREYYSYDALSEILYGERIQSLLLSADPEPYKYIKKKARIDASQIISDYNIRRVLGGVVCDLGLKKEDSVEAVHIIQRPSGEVTPASSEEASEIKAILQSTQWAKGTYQQIQDRIKEKVLPDGGSYAGVVHRFQLSSPEIKISDNDLNQKIRLHLYSRLVAIYEKHQEEYDPDVKLVLNKWGRYQLGLGSDYSFAKNRSQKIK